MKYGIFLVVLEYLHVCTCGQGLEYQSHLESMWQVASGGIWRMVHHQPVSEVSPLPVYLASALGVVLAAVEVAATICPESVGVLDDGTGGDE